jgi:hypothetical protein
MRPGPTAKCGIKFGTTFSEISKLGSNFDIPTEKFVSILKSRNWGHVLIPRQKNWSPTENVVANLIPHYLKFQNCGQIFGIKFDTQFSEISKLGSNFDTPP